MTIQRKNPTIPQDSIFMYDLFVLGSNQNENAAPDLNIFRQLLKTELERIMKKMIMSLIILTMSFISIAGAETSPEDILNAIDRMTPEQAHELQKKIAKRQWDPVPGGFFDRLAIKGSMNLHSIKDVDLSSLNLSSGDTLDLDGVGGSEVTILWQFFSDRFRAGFKGSTLYAEDSKMGSNGYSSVEMMHNSLSLVANYQWVKSDKYIWWTEASAGSANIDMNVLDTPSFSGSTLSNYDKDYNFGELTTGIDWRFNSELSLNIYAGYHFADEINMEQADKKTDITIDPTGVTAGIGLCYNF